MPDHGHIAQSPWKEDLMPSLIARVLSRPALAALLAGATLALPASALTARERLDALSAEAGRAANADNGRNFFLATHGREWSCSSCHTERPTATGRHAGTGKPIEPLAPSANAERFSNDRKVDKWFRRNCNDVLGRACSAQEKADVVAFLIAQK